MRNLFGSYAPVAMPRRTSVVAAVLAVAIGACFPAASFAQSDNMVELKRDGGQGVTGELLQFEDGLFRLQAAIGLIVVPADGVICIGAACPDGTRAEIVEKEVVLTAKDGSIVLAGTVLEIADRQYVLMTDVGEMRIDIGAVNCTGVGCANEDDIQTVGGPVVLTGAAGAIEGELIENEPESYIVDVPNLGVVRVRKDAYACTGSGCP